MAVTRTDLQKLLNPYLAKRLTVSAALEHSLVITSECHLSLATP
jgi:hypothetical protein